MDCLALPSRAPRIAHEASLEVVPDLEAASFSKLMLELSRFAPRPRVRSRRSVSLTYKGDKKNANRSHAGYFFPSVKNSGVSLIGVTCLLTSMKTCLITGPSGSLALKHRELSVRLHGNWRRPTESSQKTTLFE